MRTVSVESKLKMLRDRKSAITAKMQKLEASAKVITRKQELQRKILIGTYYLKQAVKKGALSELKVIMLKNLQRESDRKLFEDL